MKRPLISVIIPVYNVEKYLERCLKSVLNQTMKEIEVILVDDGSPDNCPNICDKYALNDERVKVIHKENAGLGFARNSGLSIATGEYIIFVDSDDYVTEDMCEKLYAAAQKYNADIVYGGIIRKNNLTDEHIELSWVKEDVVWKDGEVKDFLLNLIGTEPKEKRDIITEVSVWRMAIKKDIFDKHNISFVSEREYISEDIIFDIDYISKAKCIVAVPNYVYYYCFNPTSLTHVFKENEYEKVVVLYEKVISMLSELYDIGEYMVHTDRFLLARLRVVIRKIAHNKSIIGKKKALAIVNRICENEYFREVCERYPLLQLPLKYRVVALLMKKKWTRAILFICSF